MLRQKQFVIDHCHFLARNTTLLTVKMTCNEISRLIKERLVSQAGIAQSVERHDRSQFRAPPMSAHRYVEEIGSAAILAAKRLAGVVPEVIHTHMPPPSTYKAPHSGFEIQR